MSAIVRMYPRLRGDNKVGIKRYWPAFVGMAVLIAILFIPHDVWAQSLTLGLAYRF